MQVFVGGRPANAVSSTDEWQYRQSMPRPPTWCLWLKGTGCTTTTWAPVTCGDLAIWPITVATAASMKTAPKILTLEIVLKLRW